jgi:4-hydroxybenzoyl-CoA reductase subunit beta
MAAADGTLHLGAGVTLATLAADARIRARVAGAGRCRAGRRRPRPPQRRHAGRQPVPGHALHVLQPERMVAAGQCLLPQARRRHLPRGAAGRRAATPPSAATWHRCCWRWAAASRCSRRAATRTLALQDLYRDDGAAHLTREADELLTAVHIDAAAASQRSAYRKARSRGAMDFPLAAVAVSLAWSTAG